jgi:hypothetical protein
MPMASEVYEADGAEAGVAHAQATEAAAMLCSLGRLPPWFYARALSGSAGSCSRPAVPTRPAAALVRATKKERKSHPIRPINETN